MSQAKYGDVSWERMIRAVEKVRERLLQLGGGVTHAAQRLSQASEFPVTPDAS